MATQTAPHSGNGILDEGHDTLLRQVNALWEYWRSACDRPGLVAALNAFIGQLRSHFTLEEIILRGAGFADADRHAESHTAILETFTTIRNRVAGDPEAQPYALMEELERVLYEHELGEDIAYCACLQMAQSAESPSRSSAILQWHEDYLTGNLQIDSHHRSLMYHAERLYCLASESDLRPFRAAMQEFRSLASHHFRVEETLISEQDDAVGQTHRLAHIGLMRSLDSMIQRIEQNRLSPHSFTRDFLPFWMLNHITEADLKDFRRLAPTLSTQTS